MRKLSLLLVICGLSLCGMNASVHADEDPSGKGRDVPSESAGSNANLEEGNAWWKNNSSSGDVRKKKASKFREIPEKRNDSGLEYSTLVTPLPIQDLIVRDPNEEFDEDVQQRKASSKKDEDLLYEATCENQGGTCMPAQDCGYCVPGSAVPLCPTEATHCCCNEISAACGDGEVQPPEECDDGGNSAGDGCDETCHLEGCGNGVTDPGETCDDGNSSDGDGCSSSCTEEFCGNNSVESGEECDDGNSDAGDGCSADCTIEVCGNGIVEGDEECDDGNTDENDACSSGCVAQAFCGNNITESGEDCDDGNTTDGDGCSSTCVAEGCGNGIVEGTEECDDGNQIDDDECTNICELGPVCGNNIVEGNEECDDGNLDNDDGCDDSCRIEVVLPFTGSCPGTSECKEPGECNALFGSDVGSCDWMQVGNVCCDIPSSVCVEPNPHANNPMVRGSGRVLQNGVVTPFSDQCSGDDVLKADCLGDNFTLQVTPCPEGTICVGAAGACTDIVAISDCGNGVTEPPNEACDKAIHPNCSDDCQEVLPNVDTCGPIGVGDPLKKETINFTVNGNQFTDTDFCLTETDVANFECDLGGGGVARVVGCATVGKDLCQDGACVTACGNGTYDPNYEECEGASGCGTGQSCNSSCLCEDTLPTCGDGVVNQPSEQCDIFPLDLSKCDASCKWVTPPCSPGDPTCCDPATDLSCTCNPIYVNPNCNSSTGGTCSHGRKECSGGVGECGPGGACWLGCCAPINDTCTYACDGVADSLPACVNWTCAGDPPTCTCGSCDPVECGEGQTAKPEDFH